MRIYFLTSKLNFTTAGASVTELDLLARTLQGLGHTVTVVTAFSHRNDHSVAVPYSVIEEQINAPRLIPLQWSAYQLLKKHAATADFFHIDGHLFLYGAGLYRVRGGRVPVAAFFNRELSSWPENKSSLFPHPPERLLRRLKQCLRHLVEKFLFMPLANRIDLCAFTNPFLQQAYADFGLRRPTRFIMGDPFDYQTSMHTYGITEDQYLKRNKTKGPIVLFYSSRMAPGKGFDLLLKAFAEVKNKEQFRLVLGGDGPEEPLIRAMIRDLSLEPYVSLPGWMSKEQLYNYLKQTDIFVQARWRTDMTSYSLLDAMAFGLPSILPAGGGLQWDAQDSAVYFTDGDYKELARRIEELGANPKRRADLSRNCYQRLKQDEMNYELKAKELVAAMEKIRMKLL
ncbi:MAG: glycosyltransferase [Patescibacteria group bacterium]